MAASVNGPGPFYTLMGTLPIKVMSPDGSDSFVRLSSLDVNDGSQSCSA